MTEISSLSIQGVNLPQNTGMLQQQGLSDLSSGGIFGDNLIGGVGDSYASDSTKDMIKSQAQELVKLAKKIGHSSEESEGSSSLKKSIGKKLKALQEQAKNAKIDLNEIFSEIATEMNMNKKDQKLIQKTLHVKISKSDGASSETSQNSEMTQLNPFGSSSRSLFPAMDALSRSVKALDSSSSISGVTYSGKLIGSSADATLSLTNYQNNELNRIKDIYNKNKTKYDKVAEATGVPAELICAIHYREGGCNFGTYLHNGDPLGQPTTHVPKGKNFNDWTSAAIDAINSQKHSGVSRDNIDSQLDYAERYNGLGYRRRGIASPYVWAGTSNYSGGMYVRDGVYSSSAVDKRVGVAAILQSLYS